MITPWTLIVLYWLSVVLFIVFGIITIVGSFAMMGAAQNNKADGGGMGNLMALGGVCWGFLIMIIGPLVSRVYFEILLVVFKIYETLLEVRDNTRK